MAYQRRALAIRWAMLLRESNSFVGAAGFNSLGGVCELAYHLHPDYWGRGLMAETCRAIMQWARDEVGANSFVAFIESDNLPSLNLIQRLGFVGADDFRHGARRFTR